MADIFVPAYLKNVENCDKGDNCKSSHFDMGDNLKIKCVNFCKKYRDKLINDVNVDLKNQKMQEVGLTAQNKLGDLAFLNTIEIHEKILRSGCPNFQGCRIPVKSGINVSFFRQNLTDYSDKIICEFLEFGAPIGFEGEMINSSSEIINHKGAQEFEEEILAYLLKEASYGAIIGPFDKNPFSCNFKISPLNTVSKKDSIERRVILDLSFPPGGSVNECISKDFYLGEKVNLSYPKVDDLVGFIKDKGGNCLVFKKGFEKGLQANSD